MPACAAATPSTSTLGRLLRLQGPTVDTSAPAGQAPVWAYAVTPGRITFTGEQMPAQPEAWAATKKLDLCAFRWAAAAAAAAAAAGLLAGGGCDAAAVAGLLQACCGVLLCGDGCGGGGGAGRGASPVGLTLLSVPGWRVAGVADGPPCCACRYYSIASHVCSYNCFLSRYSGGSKATGCLLWTAPPGSRELAGNTYCQALGVAYPNDVNYPPQPRAAAPARLGGNLLSMLG